MTRAQSRYKPGDRIGGRYEVHKALMGGMGEVYLCLDLESNYPYALKTFQQHHLTNPQRLRHAFENEVATWVALEKHPNIVRCFWVQIIDNQPFMALECIASEEGKKVDLHDWLRYGPLDFKLALEIAIDICNGLIYAQEKLPGLVHRDLKPGNILIAQGGLAKITDFGLAQIVEAADLVLDNTTPITNGHQRMLMNGGGIAGTPAYMAPEQWQGEELDERTDIYAIGCILYEMVTGQPVWPNKLEDASRWQEQDSTKFPNNIPSKVSSIIDECLSIAPSARPTNILNLSILLRSIYQELLQSSPPNRPAPGEFSAADFNNRGCIYNDYLNQFKLALADFDQAIKLDATNVHAYNNRGNTYANLREYEHALADYNQAIELDSSNAQAYNNRGNVYSNVQDHERALMEYNRAIDLDPQYFHAHFNRGVTHHGLGEYDEALADYNRAIALDSNFKHAYFYRGRTYRVLEHYDDALADYTRVIVLDPIYAIAHYERGRTYHILQIYDQALADYGRAIELDPLDVLSYYDRGLTYMELQRYEQAFADFESAINLDGNNAQFYLNRGIIYQQWQKYEEGLADYKRAIELDPKLAIAYSNIGGIHHNLRNYDEALSCYNQAIAIEPSLVIAYDNRGLTQIAMQNYEQALIDFNQALDIDPQYAHAYFNRGNTYRMLMRYERALYDYQKTIELNPDFALAYVHIGAIMGNYGMHKDALMYFIKAEQLGDLTGAQFAAQARQMLGQS